MWAHPLAIPLFSAMVGLVAAYQWEIFPSPLLLIPLLLLLLVCVFAGNRFLFLVAASLCFFVWGEASLKPYLEPDFTAESVVNLADDEYRTIDGIIDERPQWKDGGGKVYLQVVRLVLPGKTVRVTGRMLLYVSEGRGDFLTGDLVRFRTRLSRPRNFGVPGEFDYERYLACRQVHVTGFVKSPASIVLLRRGLAYLLGRSMDRLALGLGNRIGQVLPGEEGAVMRALLLGDMGGVPAGLRDLYTRTGVNHILSISGFHVGVIAFFIFHLALYCARCSRFLLLRANLRSAVLLGTVPFLVFYLFLSGAAPATVRSVIMITAYMAALLLEREVDPIHSLMLAAFLILGCSPPTLFDISFQLSFLALWGILVLTPLLMAPFRRVTGIPRKLLLFLMASLAATAATLIPVSFHFHRTTLTGLIANFIIVPLLGYGAVVLGFSAMVCDFLSGSLARVLLLAAGYLVRASHGVMGVLARLPTLPAWKTGYADYFLSFLALLVITFTDRGKRISLCCCVLALFAALGIVSTEPEAGKLKIDFFSVGHGESTLVSFPDGRKMLVDGGGSTRKGGYDPGERLLAPALWKMGIRKLDYLVLTHPHPDHLNGLLFVVRNFSIGEFWENGAKADIEEYGMLKASLMAKGVPVRRISGQRVLHVGAVRLETLAPAPSDMISTFHGLPDLNDTSIVFRLVMDDFAVLFTGDIGLQTERRLSGTGSAIRCTVLKVPHHGSRFSSSSAFLDAASPKVALLGVGYGNRFGLPARETLERIRSHNATIFRTDLDGTVSIVYCNGKWEVTTFRQNRHFH
ncbi:MAG: DNA internalization-related competence protein ComEC/Rec2 [Geobacteraceae bacterium]|nr:DNA internalization-related competence protein ComEC/Rec2 [Geobacteraceae bacterium]